MRIESDALAIVPDLETDKGRKAIASVAARVAKSKTYLDGLGKEYVTELKRASKEVDAVRRDMRTRLDALRDNVRKPLTDWEVEQKRIDDAILARINAFGAEYETLEEAQNALAHLEQLPIDGSFGKHQGFAALRKDQECIKMRGTINAELDRRRMEKEAAERAEKERQAQEEQRRIAREKAEQEAAQRAEQERKRKQAAAVKAAREAAQRKADARIAAERKRLDDANKAEMAAERKKLQEKQQAELKRIHGEFQKKLKAEREKADQAMKEEAAKREAEQREAAKREALVPQRRNQHTLSEVAEKVRLHMSGPGYDPDALPDGMHADLVQLVKLAIR